MDLKNVDLRTIETGLSDEERRAAVYEAQRLRMIKQLGDKYLLSPRYNGHYIPELTRKAA